MLPCLKGFWSTRIISIVEQRRRKPEQWRSGWSGMARVEPAAIGNEGMTGGRGREREVLSHQGGRMD
jgi:hypothetical protein